MYVCVLSFCIFCVALNQSHNNLCLASKLPHFDYYKIKYGIISCIAGILFICDVWGFLYWNPHLPIFQNIKDIISYKVVYKWLALNCSIAYVPPHHWIQSDSSLKLLAFPSQPVYIKRRHFCFFGSKYHLGTFLPWQFPGFFGCSQIWVATWVNKMGYCRLPL